jgi:hypothetical protein
LFCFVLLEILSNTIVIVKYIAQYTSPLTFESFCSFHLCVSRPPAKLGADNFTKPFISASKSEANAEIAVRLGLARKQVQADVVILG